MRTLRRKSKTQRVLQTAGKAGKKAVKVKVSLAVAKRAPKVVRKAAKGGAIAMFVARVRRPLIALGAVAGGAVLAKKLTSGDDHTVPVRTAAPETYAASTPIAAA